MTQPHIDLPDALPAEPPARLYIASVAHYLPHIRKDGLYRGAPAWIQLHASPREAMLQQRQPGKPVVLAVRALDMHRRGHAFYQSGTIWLTLRVPPQFLAVIPMV